MFALKTAFVVKMVMTHRAMMMMRMTLTRKIQTFPPPIIGLYILFLN
jgi:hypothetical protein